MIVSIYNPESTCGQGEWQVWVQLVAGDPRWMGESFIIGNGPTRDAALASAVQELEAALEELQGPPGGTMKLRCPMCGEPWNGQRCEACGWKEPRKK